MPIYIYTSKMSFQQSSYWTCWSGWFWAKHNSCFLFVKYNKSYNRQRLVPFSIYEIDLQSVKFICILTQYLQQLFLHTNFVLVKLSIMPHLAFLILLFDQDDFFTELIVNSLIDYVVFLQTINCFRWCLHK